MILIKETTTLFEKTQVILTSVFNIAALTGSPNQRPSEFIEGRVLLMKKFPWKINKIHDKAKINSQKYKT